MGRKVQELEGIAPQVSVSENPDYMTNTAVFSTLDLNQTFE